MPRGLFGAFIVACSLAVINGAFAAPNDTPTTASNNTSQDAAVTAAKPAIKKSRGKRPKNVWRGYGYLPGYRTPERLEWDRARQRGPVYWYGYPRFYRGRWNGGGFGPCWTQTPIGNHWNCG